jgi:hypothetical protein
MFLVFYSLSSERLVDIKITKFYIEKVVPRARKKKTNCEKTRRDSAKPKQFRNLGVEISVDLCNFKKCH